MDTDPHGKDQHAPGAKLDAGKLRPGLVLGHFSRALTEVARVGTYGANKYSDNGWESVPNGHSRYTDAMYRHLLLEHTGEPFDQESGLRHAAQAAWNALARLEIELRQVEQAKADKDQAAKDGFLATRDQGVAPVGPVLQFFRPLRGPGPDGTGCQHPVGFVWRKPSKKYNYRRKVCMTCGEVVATSPAR